MLQTLLLHPLNRLLKGESWASNLLKAHAGKGAELAVAGARLRLLVTEAGLVEPLPADAEPSVRITLPASAIASLHEGPEQLSKQATISGDAGFAETISLLLKHLRPDVGAALSPVVGDVLAHRIESGLAQADASARQALRNLSANFVEYVRDEQALVVQQDELADWRREIAAAQENVGLLEKRIARL